MFCKFCGKQISPAVHECPYCGQLQEPRSGGNGFWDILGNGNVPGSDSVRPMQPMQPVQPAVAAQIPTKAYAELLNRRLEQTEKRLKKCFAKKLALNAAVCVLSVAACAALCGFFTSRSVNALTNDVDALAQGVNERMESLNADNREAPAAAPAATESIPPTEPSVQMEENSVFLTQPKIATLQDGKAVFSASFVEQDEQTEVFWEYCLDGQWNRIAENMTEFHVERRPTDSTLTVMGTEKTLEGMRFRCCVGETCSNVVLVNFPAP